MTFQTQLFGSCAQNSMNSNTLTLTVTVIVTETRNFRKIMPTFSHHKIFRTCENLKQRWNGIYIHKNVSDMHIQKTVLKIPNKTTAVIAQLAER